MFTEFNKINQTDKIHKFLEQTKRNGYFSKLKDLNSANNRNSDLDTIYRKKAESHYAKSIKKPFRLVDQPEYKREKNFFTNFNEYTATIATFNKIK